MILRKTIYANDAPTCMAAQTAFSCNDVCETDRLSAQRPQVNINVIPNRKTMASGIPSRRKNGTVGVGGAGGCA